MEKNEQKKDIERQIKESYDLRDQVARNYFSENFKYLTSQLPETSQNLLLTSFLIGVDYGEDLSTKELVELYKKNPDVVLKYILEGGE